MDAFQIVGIVLVKNEDVFIERVIRNVIDFCDKLIITDHCSTDRTYSICEGLAAEFPKIDLRKIERTVESAYAIAPYYNTSTWIFAVDGDEIYDPEGLQVMRSKLLAGEFLDFWCVFGNVLNVAELDLEQRNAKGYLAPPARPITKLYNFSIIEDWLDCTNERLHGEKIVFKHGYHAGLRRYLHQEIPWEDAYFRCLHFAFLKRSSLDAKGIINTRLNPDELHQIAVQKKSGSLVKYLRFRLRQLFGFDWKNKKYKRGPLVEKDVRHFFPS